MTNDERMTNDEIRKKPQIQNPKKRPLPFAIWSSLGLRLSSYVNHSRAVCSCRRFKNGSPRCCSRSSRRFVQSQLQQAQGSVPFQSRQFLWLCASLTLSRSKYFSQ